jgi:ubiquinone/menaquinone biosynthesis C-methylase UbiE
MDIQYHALRILFEEKLFYAPIDKNPQCILDIGTGTGEFPKRVVGS